MICHRQSWTSCCLLLLKKRRWRVTCRVARSIYIGYYMIYGFIVFLLVMWSWLLVTLLGGSSDRIDYLVVVKDRQLD